MAYEKFRKSEAVKERRGISPTISFISNKDRLVAIRLNVVVKKYWMQHQVNRNAELFYDKEKAMVGVKFVPYKNEETFHFTVAPRGLKIHCPDFIDFCKIEEACVVAGKKRFAATIKPLFVECKLR